MSRYIKLDDAIAKMDEWFCEPYTPTQLLSVLPTIEGSEDKEIELGAMLNGSYKLGFENGKASVEVSEEQY